MDRMDFCRTCSLSAHGIWETGRGLLLLGGLLYMSWMDVKRRKISNRVLLFLLCTGSLFLILEGGMEREWTRIQEAVIGLMVGGGLCFCCYLLSGGGIGAGDVKLFAVAGFYLGKTGLLQMAWISALLAAGSCILLLVLKKADRNTGLPYAPFVFLASAAVLAAGT